MSKRVLIVAGEASGDHHGAALVRETLRRNPDVEFFGVGGRELRAAGARTDIDMAALSVIGISEVVGAIGRVYTAYARIKRTLDQNPPDLVILIDYPELNLPVAKQAKKRSIPVLYFISPQVWAWRKGRVHKIARSVSKMLVIFPFEADFYRGRGVNAEFIGHPLVEKVHSDLDPEDARVSLGFDRDALCVGLLPGSRKIEVNYMLPVMLQAARWMLNDHPHAKFVLPLAGTLQRKDVSRWLDRSPVPVTVVESDFETAVRSCAAAMVTSGTATLHTALLGVPMVIAYRVSPLSYLVGRIFIRVKYIGIVNLIAGREVVREFIQDRANAENLARECSDLIANKEKRARICDDYRDIREKLGNRNAAENAARAALTLLDGGR